MTPMTQSVSRWLLVSALALGAGLMTSPAARFALAAEQQQPAAKQEVASVEQLTNDALAALKSGKFEQSNQLLARAASMSQDPKVRQMSTWLDQFETQRQTFATERHKQYEKAVGDVQKLLANHKESYALDATARAYLLADEKKAFRDMPWVNNLVKQTAAMADQFDKNEQWLKALRLYSDLGAIEPANPEWK